MKNKYRKNKKEIALITIVTLVISCFVIIFLKMWNAQYRNGIYHQPFCGQLNEYENLS